MRVLIVDDDPGVGRAARECLGGRGFDVEACPEGQGVWQVLASPDPPPLAIVDFALPELDGWMSLRRLRLSPRQTAVYIILLAGQRSRRDVAAAMANGADDCLTSPYHWEEVHARLVVGRRLIEAQRTLAARVLALETQLRRERGPRQLASICAHCKSIRQRRERWVSVEAFLADQCSIDVSHGICPSCLNEHYPQLEA